MATNTPVNLETLISVKITYQGTNKKFKVPLGEVGPNSFPNKLRELLNIPEDKQVTFERFSDSAGSYITLDPANTQAYKTLYRAAKAKLKLRLRATSPMDIVLQPSGPSTTTPFAARTMRQKHSKCSLSPNPVFSASEATLNNPTGGVRVSTASAARLPETKSEADDEAPVPRPFPAREHFFSELAGVTRARDLALRMKESPLATNACNWSVYCNACDIAMPDEHYHCNICDDGDYDLCESCVSAGKHCHSESHWLIRRSVKDGKVVNSTTERVAAQPKPEIEKKMPGAFAEEKKPEPEEVETPTRTCNGCIRVFPENQFMTCQTCEDYDLCLECHVGVKHGHHPGHAFKPAVEGTNMGPLAEHLAPAGRAVYHHAICDLCDRNIYGVRHKCLNCPDWDFCSKCVVNAPTAHPGHRFVAIYDPISENRSHRPQHHGIYCDGPLCNKKGSPYHQKEWISGVRYKCAICHDTDFCSNCESHPSNKHNRTHPLIMFKTPVRNVSVTTMGEDKNGSVLATMGDNNAKVSVRASVPPPPSLNAISKVQPIVDVKPVEEPAPKPVKEKIEIKDLLAEPIKEKLKVQGLLTAEKSPMEKIPVKKFIPSSDQLNAHFVRDTITDGTKMMPNQRFIQIWTLKNPGPYAWPAGCHLRYVGGDNMLNVDEGHGGISGAVASNTINRVVEVGEEVHFRVIMKAPSREGTCVSYWRLKAPDNVPFGHRMWCHIEVSSPVSPISPAAAIESKTQPGERETFRLLDEFQKTRALMLEGARKQAQILAQRKAQEEAQKNTQKQAEDEDRIRRVQMLRALHAARLAAVSAEKKEQAANMKPRSPPAPTVEDVPEKEDIKVEQPEVKSEATPVVELKSEPAVKDVEKETEVKKEAEAEAEKSTMIFPQLEKESPVSSTHEAGVPSSAATAVTARTEMASPATEDAPEIFEDAESVDFVDEESSSDGDGFLTDEEYDILDASDEEIV